MSILLILGLILFVLLVILHEWGHFIMARRNGVDVEEFGVGFPPRIKVLKKDNKNTIYTLNILPLGGFVKLKGENDSDRSPGSYGAAKLSSKISIMVAGVFMNLATAFVMLTLIAAIGMPRLIDNQFTVKSDTKISRQEVMVGYIEPGSPAQKAGIKLRDQLVSIDAPSKDYIIKSSDSLTEATPSLAGQKVVIKYQRDGQVRQSTVTLRSKQQVQDAKRNHKDIGYLGISPSEYIVQKSTWSSPIVAAGVIGQFTTETLKGLGGVIGGLLHGSTQKATEQVSGPVGIFVVLKNGSLLGLQFILMIIAVISLTLAIFNILPIPALDGGRLFVTLAFHAMRRPLTKKTEDRIHGTGFAVLMILFVLVTIVDIKRFF